MNNKSALESLASDLKRVSIGLQRNSITMADRFSKEALKRKNEVDIRLVPSYIKKLLLQLDSILSCGDISRKAEDALMYSVLFQNYAQKI